MTERARSRPAPEPRLAWLPCVPAIATIAGVALFPLGYALWESLHLHELSMPWLGKPFVGARNYLDAFADARFLAALAHTAFFAAASVSLELLLGLGLALLLHRSFFGRGLARTLALLPFCIPTVVVALLFRFSFEQSASEWLTHPQLAWVPIVLADVWKTTPFVALLLLAGLSSIDPELYEAARIDGAGPLLRFVHVTLPSLSPALLLALVFRTLDALRVFDLVYVITGGGPGTATEPISLYGFSSLLAELRFGYGSALAILLFAFTAALALLFLRLGRAALFGESR